ncbi:D-2-hydroxyacid dehydrogenase [Luteolibacter yonseiensis]|uniref:D-2-hydroxyacid dehydrogenase n=1 Tax=Luteolibacter yonseiensis TaxID=1144680 RepID=A0A934RA50_9BACT|nr:D-2-hydroxyacid dehydrogenase [Luteolibacter yonseiensis]MBK1817804.1 D-2-hydroxyacid dehydrogenase [Luteolibacter yonseiensis]
METHRIFSDSPLSADHARLLVDGAAPHEILFPKKAVASVLAKPEPDPAFALADIAFGQPDLDSIRSSGKLKWLHISTAGFTRYDTPEFRALVAERGIVVTNSSSVYARACADHVFAFMLAQSRLLPEALASQAANGSEEWFRLRSNSVSLRGQHVVILGFGGIATELVKLLVPFEMKITAMRRQPRGDEGFPTVTTEELPAALATADHVINILPDNAASQHFINAERLAQMKPGVIFHNIGRGTTVDQDALLESLRSGHLGAAWLDVTEPEPLPADHPLRSVPNCHITPHIAGGHGDESGTLVRHFLTNLNLYLAGEPLRDRIM